MPIWGNDQDGTGEYGIGRIVANDQDGSGEYEIGTVYANDQDGSGEYPVWSGSLIDDFSDGGLSEYRDATGDFTVVSSPSYTGGYALQHDPAGGTTGITSESGDGLLNYIDQGDTFQFKFRTSESSSSSTAARPGLAYGIPSGGSAASDGYALNAYTASGSFYLLKLSGGSASVVNSIDISGYTAGEWWTARCHWQTSDTHSIEVYDATDSLVGSMSPSDATHSGNNGTVGWFQYVESGASAYTDLAELVL